MMSVARDWDGDEPEREQEQERVRVGELHARGQRPAMTYRIAFEGEILRAELSHRETVEEMRQFLQAVVRNSARSATILIQVRASKPLFHVERDGLVELLQRVASAPQHRIALLADTQYLHSSHEYLELIARQRGLRVRSFRSETEARDWLNDRRADSERRAGERRLGDGPDEAMERRSGLERRHKERRSAKSRAA